MTINKVFLLLTFFTFGYKNVEAHKPFEEPMDVRLETVNFHAMNFALNDSDYAYLQQLISDYLSAENPQQAGFPIETIRNVVELNQPPQDMIELIERGTLAFSGYETENKKIFDVLWWITMREMDETNLKQLAINQKRSTRFKDLLLLIAEQGKVDVIEDIALKAGIVDYGLKIIIQKAKFKKQLQQRGKGLELFLASEVNKAFDLYISYSLNQNKYQDKLKLVSEYLIWIIKQLGVFKEEQAVHQLLVNLDADVFHYNREEMNLKLVELKPETRSDFLQYLGERLELKDRVKTAINIGLK